eukprot:3330119-Rhodomonas_salina.1
MLISSVSSQHGHHGFTHPSSSSTPRAPQLADLGLKMSSLYNAQARLLSASERSAWDSSTTHSHPPARGSSSSSDRLQFAAHLVTQAIMMPLSHSKSESARRGRGAFWQL